MLRILLSVFAALTVAQAATAQVAGSGNCPADIHQTLYAGADAVLAGGVEPERAFIFARQVGDACQKDREAISLVMNMFLAVSQKVNDPTHRTEALTLAYRSGRLAATLKSLPPPALTKKEGTIFHWGQVNESDTWRKVMAAMLTHHIATKAFDSLYKYETIAQAGCGLDPTAEADAYSDGRLLVPGVSSADEMQHAGLRLQWLAENCDGSFRLIAGLAAKLFVSMARSQITFGEGDPHATLDFAAQYLRTHLAARPDSNIWSQKDAAALLDRPDRDLGLFK